MQTTVDNFGPTPAQAKIDLYDILGVTKESSKAEIKKAYHKAALQNHPDKVREDQRTEAEIRFKQASQAYEILADDEKRMLYDEYGMDAFEKGGMGGPGGAPFDMGDILNMFMGGGGPGMPGQGPRRGEDKVQAYEVTLEELYKGKTTHFQSNKNVVCTVCNGIGGKEKAKPKECEQCKGRGVQQRLRMVGAGLMTQEMVPCSTCSGAGQIFKEKDRCKKCKGARVVEQKKMLELYIPPGLREGDKIVLQGEADQKPGQEPGHVIFVLQEVPHDTFKRAGADLAADLNVTLAEALTGFNRVVLNHLDGRGIQLNVGQPNGKILRPGQVLKIEGEGMPVKRSETKGDLYLEVNIEFPEDGWLTDETTSSKLREILPKPEPPIEAEEIEEVEFDADASIEGFGAGYGEDGWEDEDGPHGAQCTQQ